MKKWLWKICTHACIYYTVTVFLLLFVYLILSKDLSDGMRPLALVMIFPFSLSFAGANILLREARFSKVARVACHAALTLGGIWLFLVLPNRDPSSSASQLFILFIVFFFLYALVMSVILLVSARIHRVKRDEGEYRKVYKK